ncbi:hypothetical protein LSTR_LSTR014374 [Laodelphax striatellus]|uniref:NADH dehydrogenase [ubiquinone] 1 alpha subcomplex assembly factor 3 n=1 Tax=Laodelphax striatellus TaxID=195883 RepID=A0A482WLZ3_LAOST|nr:hypothetical protein LSTR_LSTR014777 [Laodelphax striatellus]RZF47333.1 hypothetical protein LSTR_LSTR014374 [Laodelphax striatellus]
MKILKCFEPSRKLATHLYVSSWKRHYCFNEDQRTTVDVLNQPGRTGPLMINSYGTHGFRLSNGLFAVGPVILFPSTVVSWNVANDEDISEESLCIFSKIVPKLDIVLVGLAGKVSESAKHMNRIHQVLRKYKVNCEVMSTERACPTFNFLNVEGRHMAAALIPPLKVQMSDDDLRDEFNRYKEHMNDDYLLYTDVLTGNVKKDPVPKTGFLEPPKGDEGTKNNK